MLLARHAQGLLPFIGEGRPGVRVTAVERVHLPAANRPVAVLRLERDGLVWYRNLEFQAERDIDIPRRCFEHNSSLILHYDVPVFTTVVYLLPGADKDVPDAFRLYVGDWLAYEWRFDVVRLWEIDAESALRAAKPGRSPSCRFCAAGPSLPWCAKRCGGWTRCRRCKPRNRCWCCCSSRPGPGTRPRSCACSVRTAPCSRGSTRWASTRGRLARAGGFGPPGKRARTWRGSAIPPLPRTSSPRSRRAMRPRRCAPGPCSAPAVLRSVRGACHGQANGAGGALAGDPALTALDEAPLTESGWSLVARRGCSSSG